VPAWPPPTTITSKRSGKFIARWIENAPPGIGGAQTRILLESGLPPYGCSTWN
jgi:hypothetical protein